MLDYNLAGSQKLFFNLVSGMYLDLMANKGITTEHTKQAYQLGWSMELVSVLFQGTSVVLKTTIRSQALCISHGAHIFKVDDKKSLHFISISKIEIQIWLF